VSHPPADHPSPAETPIEADRDTRTVLRWDLDAILMLIQIAEVRVDIARTSAARATAVAELQMARRRAKELADAAADSLPKGNWTPAARRKTLIRVIRRMGTVFRKPYEEIEELAKRARTLAEAWPPELIYRWAAYRLHGQIRLSRRLVRKAAEKGLCLAQRREGRGRCLSAPTSRGGRCRYHGGRSTGPKTAEGRKKIGDAKREWWRRQREIQAAKAELIG